VSRFHKIFLATALIVVGFGVAKFLGQPIPVPQALETRGLLAQTGIAPAEPAAPQADAPTAPASVRLLPESTIAAGDLTAANPLSSLPQPPLSGSTLALAPAGTNPPNVSDARQSNYAPIPSARVFADVTPQARLRNEAPRPIGVDPHSPVAIRRTPQTVSEPVDPYKVSAPQNNASSWPAPQLLNAAYSDAGPAPPTAVATSYSAPPVANALSAPTSTSEDSHFAPPPWPMAEADAAPRMHVIVDGDSLERLAGRYLDDPRRSKEIYELNHDVLTSPDLLPIGAELKIPERVATASWERESSRPRAADLGTTREAANHNLVPIRPATSPQAIVPRAQLSRPIMAQ